MSDKKPNIQPKISDKIAQPKGCGPGLVNNHNVNDNVATGGRGGQGGSGSVASSASAYASASVSGSCGACGTCAPAICK